MYVFIKELGKVLRRAQSERWIREAAFMVDSSSLGRGNDKRETFTSVLSLSRRGGLVPYSHEGEG